MPKAHPSRQKVKPAPNTKKVSTLLCPELNLLVQKAGGSEENISQMNLRLPVATWLQGTDGIIRSQDLREGGLQTLF